MALPARYPAIGWQRYDIAHVDDLRAIDIGFDHTLRLAGHDLTLNVGHVYPVQQACYRSSSTASIRFFNRAAVNGFKMYAVTPASLADTM